MGFLPTKGLNKKMSEQEIINRITSVMNDVVPYNEDLYRQQMLQQQQIQQQQIQQQQQQIQQTAQSSDATHFSAYNPSPKTLNVANTAAAVPNVQNSQISTKGYESISESGSESECENKGKGKKRIKKKIIKKSIQKRCQEKHY